MGHRGGRPHFEETDQQDHHLDTWPLERGERHDAWPGFPDAARGQALQSREAVSRQIFGARQAHSHEPREWRLVLPTTHVDAGLKEILSVEV